MTQGTPQEITIAVENAYSQDALILIDHLSKELGDRYGDDGSGAFTPSDLDVSGTAFVIARIDGKPVGCGALRFLEPGIGEVKRMFVEPKMRGRGISRKILQKIEELAKDFGYRALWLETGTKQPEAIHLYETSGYRRIDCYGKYRGNPQSICFEKRLG